MNDPLLYTKNVKNLKCISISRLEKKFLAVFGSKCQMLPHYQARKPWISWRIRWRRKNYIKLIVRLKERRKKTDFKGKLEQMAVKFYQLFANSLRWSLDNLKIWKISKRKTQEFEEILPTFCHGTKVKPWKIWKKITKIIVRLTRGRKKGRKKLNKQTNKGNLKK